MSTIRVDRITPYQSGSVAIEGLSISNLTIDGTLTASIQEGFVLVGGAGNVSKLAATSSFGGGGGFKWNFCNHWFKLIYRESRNYWFYFNEWFSFSSKSSMAGTRF
jgi:hypothetical protein